MKMRLIDADALKESYVEAIEYRDEVVSVYAIDNAPTIEAMPVRHGVWRFGGDNVVECSNCGETYFSNVSPRNYCSNCGAKMDGDI